MTICSRNTPVFRKKKKLYFKSSSTDVIRIPIYKRVKLKILTVQSHQMSVYLHHHQSIRRNNLVAYDAESLPFSLSPPSHSSCKYPTSNQSRFPIIQEILTKIDFQNFAGTQLFLMYISGEHIIYACRQVIS